MKIKKTQEAGGHVPACFLLSGVGCWRDPARPGRPLPSRRAGAGDDPAQRPPFPLPPRRGGRCADPGASHPSAAAAASGDPVTSRASPFPRGVLALVDDPGASRASPSATAGGAGGGDPGAFVAPSFSRPWRAWWVRLIRARPGRPLPPWLRVLGTGVRLYMMV